MLFKCKCEKCKAELDISFDSTIEEYVKEFESRKIYLTSEEPPIIFNYFIVVCTNTECKYIKKMFHDEIIELIEKQWSKLAWSYYLSRDNTQFNFHEYFTKYIMLKGLNKIVTQKDLDNNKVLRDYVKYVEGKLTEDS